jgi:catechol 2,3-dioxygenase-like lactoylglutathione lyase family enzyme
MRYLHTMVRVRDPDVSLDFYCNRLDLKEVRRALGLNAEHWVLVSRGR